ncbi:hypothetical protein HZB01_02210 [Candidatus Woesearchaeota archaeon]|nr:hypothetical protein [Candidatus Woesearchaeota archaeon]
METKQVGKNLPEKKFNAGPVGVTIWKNKGAGKDGSPVEFRSTQIERRYKDKNGQWQGTNSLRLNDLPRAIVVLQKAYEYLIFQQKENGQSPADAEDMIY